MRKTFVALNECPAASTAKFSESLVVGFWEDFYRDPIEECRRIQEGVVKPGKVGYLGLVKTWGWVQLR